MVKKEKDVREEGRFFEIWADDKIINDLEKCFSHYREEDIKRALKNTMDLFRWVAEEVSEELGFEYDSTADERCTEWLEENLFEYDQ